MLGSVRAEVQHWDVDVPKGEATWSPSGFRQKRPSASPLDVAQLAAEVAASVAAGLVDPRLVWSGQTRVTVLVGEIIPMTVKQTTAGRRRRFATQLEALLSEDGWQRTGSRSRLTFVRAQPLS